MEPSICLRIALMVALCLAPAGADGLHGAEPPTDADVDRLFAVFLAIGAARGVHWTKHFWAGPGSAVGGLVGCPSVQALITLHSFALLQPPSPPKEKPRQKWQLTFHYNIVALGQGPPTWTSPYRLHS